MAAARWTWTVWCLVAACAAPRQSFPEPPPVSASPVQRAPVDDEGPRKAEAARLLRAYGDSHALGADRRPPTPDELAAAAIADSIDPSIDANRWAAMDPPMRMLVAYRIAQHTAWSAACAAGVEQWWRSAQAIDRELELRLQQAPPAELHAGLTAWNSEWDWLRVRQEGDPAVRSLPALASVGAVFRLTASQNAWALTWAAPLERALSERTIPVNAWALEDLATEQARFCAAAYTDGLHTWPPPGGIKVIKPGGPWPLAGLIVESGSVARVGKLGTELRVTRRDWTTTLASVPPCKRVRCTGIDCSMDERGGWRDICAEKQIRRFEDHAFMLHLDAPPVVPRVGDVVSFYLEPSTGHAVLATVSRRADQPPYFTLGR